MSRLESAPAAVRLGLFVLVLAGVFGAALGVGNLFGPTRAAASVTAAAPAHGHGEEATAEGADHGVAASGPATEHASGLQIAQDGYRLSINDRQRVAGDVAPIEFRILGPDGAAVTAFDTTHDKDLHLVVVRRDLTGFQHLHPTMAADGTWTVPVVLPTAGEYRVFADFVPTGHQGLTLGADLAVAGTYEAEPLPTPTATAVLQDGYAVTLDGTLVPGSPSVLTLTVAKNGAPVRDLQPYLAAFGHLVVLRDGDLAYLHAHPEGAPGDGRTTPGPSIAFTVTAPSAGDYGLFFDFQHADEAHTAAFAAAAGEPR